MFREYVVIDIVVSDIWKRALNSFSAFPVKKFHIVSEKINGTS